MSDLEIDSKGWILKARITNKTNIKCYEKKNDKKGYCINIDIIDSEG